MLGRSGELGFEGAQKLVHLTSSEQQGHKLAQALEEHAIPVFLVEDQRDTLLD